MTYKDNPIGFIALIFFPIGKRKTYRFHRVVIHPNYQNIGIGKKFMGFVADLYCDKYSVYIISSHPAVYHGLNKSKKWIMTRKTSFAPTGNLMRMNKNTSKKKQRLTATFKYICDKKKKKHI